MIREAQLVLERSSWRSWVDLMTPIRRARNPSCYSVWAIENKPSSESNQVYLFTSIRNMSKYSRFHYPFFRNHLELRSFFHNLVPEQTSWKQKTGTCRRNMVPERSTTVELCTHSLASDFRPEMERSDRGKINPIWSDGFWRRRTPQND